MGVSATKRNFDFMVEHGGIMQLLSWKMKKKIIIFTNEPVNQIEKLNWKKLEQEFSSTIVLNEILGK